MRDFYDNNVSSVTDYTFVLDSENDVEKISNVLFGKAFHDNEQAYFRRSYQSPNVFYGINLSLDTLNYVERLLDKYKIKYEISE